MNKHLNTLLFLTLMLAIILYPNMTFAQSNIKTADALIKKAEIATNTDDKDSYATKALKYYNIEYGKNNLNIDAMIGIGRAYTYLDDRTYAKNILMEAYSTFPDNPKTQAALGDFSFYFQEYNTALEFYKLALSSGYLKDYKTNLSTAICYEKLGDMENAKLYYKISLSLNPGSQEAKKGIETIISLNTNISKPNNSSSPTVFEKKD